MHWEENSHCPTGWGDGRPTRRAASIRGTRTAPKPRIWPGGGEGPVPLGFTPALSSRCELSAVGPSDRTSRNTLGAVVGEGGSEGPALHWRQLQVRHTQVAPGAQSQIRAWSQVGDRPPETRLPHSVSQQGKCPCGWCFSPSLNRVSRSLE